MANFHDGGGVVLEESSFDVYRLLLERFWSEGSEGEPLVLLDEESNKWCHLLLCQPDGFAFTGAAVVQVKTTVAVPVTVQNLVNLCLGRLDEDEVV